MHLDFHVFAYLRKNYHPKVVLDTSEPDHNGGKFWQVQWGYFYPHTKEEIPRHVPPPGGNCVQHTSFVESDCIGELITGG